MQPRADHLVALAGNPNTGKSTVFNSLTGLRQHTGNWPGKTVTLATGGFRWKGKSFTVVDLPGTYSLHASSPDEEVARDFLCFGSPSVSIVVVDATCLERNLNLVLQVIEMIPNVVVCLNLVDEARRQNLRIDAGALRDELGVPIVPCAARQGEGICDLKDAVFGVATGQMQTSPRPPTYGEAIERRIQRLHPHLETLKCGVSSRWLALQLLDQNSTIIRRLLEIERGDTPLETLCFAWKGRRR